jgi:predicted esterase
MDYRNYKLLDARIDARFEARDFESALGLIDQGLEAFPDRSVELDAYRLACHRELGHLERCLELMDEGLAAGRFYSIYWKSWDALRSLPGYAELDRRNRSNRDRAQVESLPRFQVVTPPGHDASRPHPLAIVLHGDGNGCHLDTMVHEWSAGPYLRRGFVVCYMQSSRVECTGGFGWTRDYGRSRSEIHGMMRKVAEQCRIDERCVVLGGFSGGAMASVDLLFDGSLPLKGVIALCPASTGGENPEALALAAAAGTRVVLLEGELSGLVEDQVALAGLLREAGVAHAFLRNPGIGHAIPADMDARLEEALDFILRP